MITTIDIPSVYDPGDGSVLFGRIYVPDPVMFPGPYPCWVGTHSPGFQYDTLQSLSKVFGGLPGNVASGLAGNGILCLAGNVRGCAANGQIAPGQTTDGGWHMQTDDMKGLVRYMRPGGPIETVHSFDVTGFVGTIGGSGSGHHALYAALDGTAGDDKADAAIPMSAVTDMGDRDNTTGGFNSLCEGYGESMDLAVLTSRSPIALNLAIAKAIFMANGDHENMPASNLTRFRDAMIAAGATSPNFEWRLLTGAAGAAHAFAEWQFIFAEAIPWALARIAEFSGSEPPPPPDDTGRELITAVISGLPPDAEITLNVQPRAISSGLEGPVTSFDFISDRAGSDTGGKDAPVGVYAKVASTNGIIDGNIATRAWLGFSYVDGGCFDTPWSVVNPTSRSSFDWTQPDAFLAAMADNDKLGGLAIEMGVKSPPWISSGPNRVSMFQVHGPNSGFIPIPWDPNYLQRIKDFAKQMAARFDANANLSHVIASGLGGQIIDTLMVQDSIDYTNLNARAITDGFPSAIAGWSQAAAGILDVWVKAFKQTKVYLAINLPVPSVNGGLTGIDEFTRASISAYKSRLAIMNLQLDGLTQAGPDLSLAKIMHDANQSARAYRYLWPSSNAACDPSQDPGSYVPLTGLNNAGQAGITIGAQMEEFYESDILTVTGGYPAALTALRADLAANA